MAEEINFNCTKCGACCRTVPDNMLKYYGLPISSKGGCGYLLKDNTCQIYDSRPDICNVNTMWKTKHSLVMTWEDYCKLSEEMCKILVEIDSNRQQGDTNVDQTK